MDEALHLRVLLISLHGIGHFLLTKLLLDKMKATAKQTGIQGRIINVASNTHHQSDGSFFDLNTINDQSKSVPLHIK